MSERSDQHNSTSPPRHGLSCSEAHSESGIFVKPIESATRGASMVGRNASHAAHVGRAIGLGSGSHARANGPAGSLTGLSAASGVISGSQLTVHRELRRAVDADSGCQPTNRADGRHCPHDSCRRHVSTRPSGSRHRYDLQRTGRDGHAVGEDNEIANLWLNRGRCQERLAPRSRRCLPITQRDSEILRRRDAAAGTYLRERSASGQQRVRAPVTRQFLHGVTSRAGVAKVYHSLEVHINGEHYDRSRRACREQSKSAGRARKPHESSMLEKGR